MQKWLVLLAALALCGCSAAYASPAPKPTATFSGPPTSPSSSGTPVVVTIGDSIMRGHGLGSTQAWPMLLATQNGWNVTNLGCDSAGVIALGNEDECDSDFSGLVEGAIALQATTVIFEGSSNDLGESSDDLAAATTQEVAALHAALPNALIIGLSTVWNDQSDVPPQIDELSDEVNSAVSAVGGIYLDLGQPLQGHPEWMQYDDVHPTAGGQAALAAAIQAALTKAGISAR